MTDTVQHHTATVWPGEIVPALKDYVRIPCVSRHYEPAWAELGYMEQAVELVVDWCRRRAVAGLTVEVQRIEGLTPLVVMEVPAFGGGPADDTVLLYGHLDKQPEMSGWRDDLGPWLPVVEGDKLYGRGGADDGYAAFASVVAIEAAQAAGYPHARCLVLIEASEESGSCDLPAHIERLGDRIGSPSLVICLDGGCLDDQRLWVSTSLRGLAGGHLRVDILREGVHSGEASGVVPSSFRIARQLLSRIEDEATGRVLLPEAHVDIPADRVAEAEATAAEVPPVAGAYPFVEGAGPTTDDPVEQLLARTWRPALSIVGADGFPPPGRAGNVLRPMTDLQLSLRLPPTADDRAVGAAMERALTGDPPYGARVTFTPEGTAPGWNAPPFAPWLADSLERASVAAFGQPARAFGEGGTIPFMGMLGQRFPDAQFVVTGALGPGSNAHGPNEFLHLPTAERITSVIAYVLRDHANRGGAR